MSLASAHAHLLSTNLLNVVPLFDGEWLELRHCSITTNRAANQHVHRSRWSRFMRATIELLAVPRTRECAVASEALDLD